MSLKWLNILSTTSISNRLIFMFCRIQENNAVSNDVIQKHSSPVKNELHITFRYILPQTTVISDCWKAYATLNAEDFIHLKVNHSIEFVNTDGDHTNTIEGHWRHAKLLLPKFGPRKSLFASYLGEFMWRYQHKGTDLFSVMVQRISEVEFNSDHWMDN